MCSVISLKGDSVQAVARTMDFNITLVGDAVRNFRSGTGHSILGKLYTFKQDVKAVCNVEALIICGVQEAINQSGLSFSLLYNIDNSMAKSGGTADVLTWPIYVMSECGSVKEVQDRLTSEKPIFKGPANMQATCHFFFTDTTGAAIVIEFHDGIPTVYNCPLGVMTNGPEYSWHMTNLRNYLNVNPQGEEKRTWVNADFDKIGHGNGFLGVPGGNGSPDRFIRLSLNKAYAKDVTDKNVVAKAANLIGMAHTLYGTQTSKGWPADVTGQDETLWTTVKYLDKGTKKPMLWIRRVPELNFSEVESLREEADAA